MALGKEKELNLSTYKAVGQSVIKYCAPVWTPSISNSNWEELQSAKNSSLWSALWCVKMSSEDHLHSHALMMPVNDHNEMLSRQFLLATLKLTTPPKLTQHSDLSDSWCPSSPSCTWTPSTSCTCTKKRKVRAVCAQKKQQLSWPSSDQVLAPP